MVTLKYPTSIIPFIEGDGVGSEITTAMIKIIDAAVDQAIQNKTVTADFAHMMEDATWLTCPEFADAVVANM